MLNQLKVEEQLAARILGWYLVETESPINTTTAYYQVYINNHDHGYANADDKLTWNKLCYITKFLVELEDCCTRGVTHPLENYSDLSERLYKIINENTSIS